ncbi:MAG: ATP synthase F0 subunit A [Verrucomicrobia bacterium GWF2_51_19]|nr:MAG: ATP synthase F0 subunit A [Verrucomicrobia bacterium GWF2_51_19]HCJ12605.1 ATP synthase F0 subunit A [Opitutae bacterium]
MSLLKKFLVISGFLLFANASFAGEDIVSPKAYDLFYAFGKFPITNAMVTSWTISLFIIVIVRLCVRTPQIIPTRGQAIIESMIIGIRDVAEPIVGKRMIGKTFPLLIGLFTYILIQNWSGLFPGVATFGIYEGHHLLYFFRPANSDLNDTLALAVVAFFAWVYFIVRYAGPHEIYQHIFGNKADKSSMPYTVYLFLFVIFFFVGFIECISILFRVVSLSFRLYGNVFGGEVLMTLMTNASGFLKFLVPIPFYFLELLIGAIQAFVFTVLVSVYIGLICNHEEEHTG